MSATMFKAVVWKELHENLKWAIFVLLGMSVALATAIPSPGGVLRGQGVDVNGIAKVLDVTTTIGGLLAGLLIGAAQALVENRGDKWGFLAHRPIDRTAQFWSKAAAGIALYVASTCAPVAATLLLTASPGYLPFPFDWRIALPAVANLLCGLVFYFAAFLTGMRDARWYGSRALGIGTAACCLTLQVAVAAEFWQAVLASAAGLLIVGTAAWGTFVAGGQYGVQPRIGRIATGLSIGLGMTLVGTIVLVIHLNTFADYEVLQGASSYTTYTVTTEGVVAKVTRQGGQILEVIDPDGRPLERYRNPAPGQKLNAGVMNTTLPAIRRTPPSFRSSGRLFSQLRRATAADPVGWYYVHRLGLLAAYDSLSGKQIGWMGPDGFSPGDAKPRPFATRLTGAGPNSLVLADAVYRLDLDKQQVEKDFQAEPGEEVLATTGWSYNTPAARAELGEMAPLRVISTTRRVIVDLGNGTRVLETPQDAKALESPMLRVFRAVRAPGAPVFLWYQNYSEGESRISEFNAAGAVVNSWTLPATRNYSVRERLLRVVVTSAIFPLIDRQIFAVNDRIVGLDFSRYKHSETVRWTVAVFSMLVSAAAVFVHGRRYAFRRGRLSAWMGIALLLGPLGYLLMLALIEWPARESCPACNKKRVVTRERCEHCGEPFAAPPQDGTEIFEPAP